MFFQKNESLNYRQVIEDFHIFWVLHNMIERQRRPLVLSNLRLEQNEIWIANSFWGRMVGVQKIMLAVDGSYSGLSI